ncbi:MAG: plastocyanin/azurin family copper-binding protein [bacterium]
MRFYTLALLAGATVLSACAGGDNAAKDTSKAAPPAGAPAPAAGAALAPMPATGDTVTVKMVGDDKGYRFEPAAVTIKTGQAVKFVMTSGGPHNVAFDPTTVPADSKDQLNANMTGQMSELSSPILMNPNEAYVISFAGVKPGTYPFHCTPHLAMNMKGTLTVQ